MTQTSRRHLIVADVVAAEALEGWRPDEAETAALHALAAGDVSMTDYLAGCRARYRDPDDVRRPALARRRPYLIRGTTVLENNFRLCTHHALQAAEFAVTAGRLVQAHLRDEPVGTTVTDLHRHVFADVYAWAGEPRITGISKGGTVFAPVDEIAEALRRLHDDVDEAFTCADGYSTTALTYRLSRIYADYNMIHPFREGNGRTGTLLLTLIARTAGRRLDLSGVTRERWIYVARAAATGLDTRGDLAPLRAVICAALVDADVAGLHRITA
ncbi:cell filamentation protein Fic [Gordonia sp. TBRC 11910]|uniref:protein adenylyltransferase n=1 Tax=Gordonia asplenii TaxID=2725283 RepID=A0A848KXW7_9ACTN|nr:Fic family protein [Gordonia asplenii]NMO00298.1 cell filamentation protein Fic [Gordonia asplenii]